MHTRTLAILAAVALTIGLGIGTAGAESISASIDTGANDDWESDDNNGSRYDYKLGSIPHLMTHASGDTTEISGTISDLFLGSSSSYLEVGLVAQNRADDSIGWDWPPYMFNQSAYMLVSRNNANDVLVRAGDYSGTGGTSDPINLGSATDFDFDINLASDGETGGGTLTVTVGENSVSCSYGQDNWEYGYGVIQDDEFVGDYSHAYGIVQGFVENLDSEPKGKVKADVEMSVVPEPLTMLAVGSAVAGLGGYIRRRRRG